MAWFLKVKKILAVFLEFCSNWLRLITLCENITLFWTCGPDCKQRRITMVPRFENVFDGPRIPERKQITKGHNSFKNVRVAVIVFCISSDRALYSIPNFVKKKRKKT